MNFLSHFYFDRNNPDPHQVIGMVLPDLLKNAKKEWIVRPEKHELKYTEKNLSNIFKGWKRHIAVDKHFHSSAFFLIHTQNIRTTISPFLEHSPARPFFVAHIALELMLDSLLLSENLINSDNFYTHLQNSSKDHLNTFLEINNVAGPQIFFSFLDEFVEARYLNTYIDPNQVVYALNRICMRVWDNPFNETQKLQLTATLINYYEKLQADFMNIFNEIEEKLTF